MLGEYTIDEGKGRESRERRPRTITGLSKWAAPGPLRQTAGPKRTMGRNWTSGLLVVKAVNTKYALKHSSYENSNTTG